MNEPGVRCRHTHTHTYPSTNIRKPLPFRRRCIVYSPHHLVQYICIVRKDVNVTARPILLKDTRAEMPRTRRRSQRVATSQKHFTDSQRSTTTSIKRRRSVTKEVASKKKSRKKTRKEAEEDRSRKGFVAKMSGLTVGYRCSITDVIDQYGFAICAVTVKTNATDKNEPESRGRTSRRKGTFFMTPYAAAICLSRPIH